MIVGMSQVAASSLVKDLRAQVSLSLPPSLSVSFPVCLSVRLSFCLFPSQIPFMHDLLVDCVSVSVFSLTVCLCLCSPLVDCVSVSVLSLTVCVCLCSR
jgi:hypothetical protein